MENEWKNLATFLISSMIIGAAIAAAQNDPNIISIIPMISATPIIEQSNDQRVNTILANIDPEVRKRIVSVNIVNNGEIPKICERDGIQPLGCADSNYTLFGNLRMANIYLVDNYDDECYTFEYVLYHEIGHVEDIYKNGYASAIGGEDYANNFADQYVKNKCYNPARVQAEPYWTPTPTPAQVASNDYIFDIDREAGIILYERGDCVIMAIVNTGVNEESGICTGNDWNSFMREKGLLRRMV